MTSTKGCELAQRNPSQTGMTEAASKGDDSKKFSLLQSCALNTMVSRSISCVLPRFHCSVCTLAHTHLTCLALMRARRTCLALDHSSPSPS